MSVRGWRGWSGVNIGIGYVNKLCVCIRVGVARRACLFTLYEVPSYAYNATRPFSFSTALTLLSPTEEEEVGCTPNRCQRSKPSKEEKLGGKTAGGADPTIIEGDVKNGAEIQRNDI